MDIQPAEIRADNNILHKSPAGQSPLNANCWMRLSHTIFPAAGKGRATAAGHRKPKATHEGKICNARPALSGIVGLRGFLSWRLFSRRAEDLVRSWVLVGVGSRKPTSSADRAVSTHRLRTLGSPLLTRFRTEECARPLSNLPLHSASASVCKPNFAPISGSPLLPRRTQPAPARKLPHSRPRSTHSRRTAVSALGSPSAVADIVTRSPFSLSRRGLLLCPPKKMDRDQ